MTKETRAALWAKAKLVVSTVWHQPGVEAGVLRLITLGLVRVGLPAGIGAILIEVVKALTA